MATIISISPISILGLGTRMCGRGWRSILTSRDGLHLEKKAMSIISVATIHYDLRRSHTAEDVASSPDWYKFQRTDLVDVFRGEERRRRAALPQGQSRTPPRGSSIRRGREAVA